jgi:diaminopimelate decarboxylase
MFAEDRPLPEVAAGDLLAIFSAGAYGATMASPYNSRLAAPEVLVRGDRFDIVRARPTHEAMLAAETVPDWLSPSARDGSARAARDRPGTAAE